ncbi:Fur-regulated basic protein FbpA [Sporolactobacillus sp. STCC-11]|uniref:Fur-regulated basic protein FbpA n=1 Tax=Sporolactobacillus caesalpiniae TaxID=3230362 RepID=UPI003398233F
MGSVQKKSIENRQERLIEQLIAHEVYKINGKHLFQLPLSELEHEYKHVRNLHSTM